MPQHPKDRARSGICQGEVRGATHRSHLLLQEHTLLMLASPSSPSSKPRLKRCPAHEQASIGSLLRRLHEGERHALKTAFEPWVL